MAHAVYLRADASPDIGWGHVNRMCSLAALLPAEMNTVAVTNAAGAEVFHKSNCKNLPLLEVVPGDFAEEWQGILPEHAILVLDGYHFDFQYQQKAKKAGFKVVLIDDFAHGPFCADMVLNHAPGSRSLYHQTGIDYCCGLDFALLRPSFYQEAASFDRAPNNVLVTLGGADPLGLTFKILAELLPLHPQLNWVAVCTDNFSKTHRTSLETFSAKHPQLQLLYNLGEKEMRLQMSKHRYAIVSASTVVLESWASGLFPATLCYTQNQQLMFKGATSMGYAFPLHREHLSSGFSAYLKTEGITNMTRTGTWNPPDAVAKAFHDILNS